MWLVGCRVLMVWLGLSRRSVLLVCPGLSSRAGLSRRLVLMVCAVCLSVLMALCLLCPSVLVCPSVPCCVRLLWRVLAGWPVPAVFVRAGLCRLLWRVCAVCCGACWAMSWDGIEFYRLCCPSAVCVHR